MFQTLWPFVSVAYKLMEVVTALGWGPGEKLLANGFPRAWGRFFWEAENSFVPKATSACELGLGDTARWQAGLQAVSTQGGRGRCSRRVETLEGSWEQHKERAA